MHYFVPFGEVNDNLYCTTILHATIGKKMNSTCADSYILEFMFEQLIVCKIEFQFKDELKRTLVLEQMFL